MNKYSLAVSICLALGPLPGAALHAGVPILPFDDVIPGSHGVGRTVFTGTTVETFDVEILGKLTNVGPGRNLILARCSGGPLERTGILSGMSGSPVTIDGKLIGAVAYSWGFSKEPIAGITPIEEMFALTRLDSPPGAGRNGRLSNIREHLEALGRPDLAERLLSRAWRSSAERSTSVLPIALPVSVAGIGPAGLARIGPRLTEAGFLPLQVGGAGSSTGPPPAIEPGAAVGLKLARGDVEMTATGTVTWVEGDDVLAFGHPLFGLGEVDLPLTGATVQALLPSLRQSARIATPLAEVGALRQDRATGVLGRLNATPRMIPVRLNLSGPLREEKTFSFDIADDPLLSPLLLFVSLSGLLAGEERTAGSATVRLGEGSVIQMADAEDVALDNLFSGSEALRYGTGLPAYILHLLMNNTWVQPHVTAVNLLMEYDDLPRTGMIRRAVLDRYLVRAGDSVHASVVLAPYRGGEQLFHQEIEIPAETPPGTLELRFGSALSVLRDEARDEVPLPSSLDQLIRLINRIRRNDRIYILATRDDAGVMLGGARLPNLPPSAATLLSRPKTRGDVVTTRMRAVLERVIETDFAVAGSATIELEVVAP